MTQKERLQQVLNGQKIDRPPCICPGGMMNMVTTQVMEHVNIYLPDAHTDARKMADLAKAVHESKCFENYGVPFCMTVEAEAMGAKVDLGSKIYEPHVVQYAIQSVEQWKELSSMDCNRGRAKVVLDAIRLLKKETSDIPIIGNITGPVSTATSMIEPVIFYKQLRKNAEEIHNYMNFITKQLIAFGLAQVEAGADVIAISDPSGTGEILGPKRFQQFVVTYMNQLIEGLQKKNINMIVHICGQMHSVYKEVNQIQSDALSFDSVVSMKEAREQLGERVLMGNVSTYAIEFGDPEKVNALTKRCVQNGADIISPACGLGMKSPLKNVQAILKALKEEETYEQSDY